MVTARDVAKKLGVAISTVGRALADDPRISDATQERVRRVATQMGYVGHGPARIMRGGSSHLIGLTIPDVVNEFYASIAQSMSMTLNRRGYRLVLSVTGDDREIEAAQIKELVAARASGIIMVPTSDPKLEARALLKTIPHAQLLRFVAGLGEIKFGIDDEQAVYTAATKLISAGHRRIAFLGGRIDQSTGFARQKGFRRAIADSNLSSSEATEIIGEPTIEFGCNSTVSLLEGVQPPTAILATSVYLTMGVIRAIERLGIAIPDDLSVIGFGDSPWFESWRGGLTVMSVSMEQIATTCGLWFTDMLMTKAPQPQLIRHSSTLACYLVERISVGHPRRRKLRLRTR
jgi:DNA-binding LacI/PurR family transcriptional regulator